MSETSDFELYKILNHKRASFIPEAILCAEKEFRNRKFTDIDISNFKRNLEREIKAKEEQSQKNSNIEKVIRDSLMLAIPTDKGSIPRNILSFSIFLSLVYAYNIIANYSVLWYTLTDPNYFDFSVVLFVGPFILFPIGIFGLIKSRKFGWYIVSGLLSYYTISLIIDAIIIYQISTQYENGGGGGMYYFIEDLIPVPAIGVIFVNLLVLSGSVYFLCKKDTLKYFAIHKKDALTFVSVITMLTSVLWWKVY